MRHIGVRIYESPWGEAPGLGVCASGGAKGGLWMPSYTASSRPLKEALAKVNKVAADYPLERKNMIQIVRAIYTEEWAKHMSVDGARAAFTADCEVQQ
jgi:hypothetical protein